MEPPTVGSSAVKKADFLQTTEKRYVLVLYTGGTIGMKESPDGLIPEPGYLQQLVSTYPNMNDTSYTVTTQDTEVMKTSEGDLTPLAMPVTQDGYRIVYGILEFDPVLDSSNMNMSDWTKIATHVYSNYQPFDGFVILHGTDTMAYTSSALSFMLEGLGKAVVVTGSQVPMVQVRTDAINNFVGALILAGRYATTIPEVGLFFNSQLFRGNRVTKINASEFDAFDSPNYPPLATIGVNIRVFMNVNPDAWFLSDLYMDKVDKDLIFSTSHLERLTLHPTMVANVGNLMIFPGISASTIKVFLKPLEGAVVLTFGAGNGPDKDEAILEAFTHASKTTLMVNITQCLKGRVADAYATGTALKNAGLIPGADMTFEAGLTKVSYLLGRTDLTLEQKKLALQQNLRGELTLEQEGTIA